MAYINQTGLEERFGADEIAGLLDDDRDETVEGEEGDATEGEEIDALTRACEDASSLIDGYLVAGGYTLPLAEPFPGLVIGWAGDIARFKLWDDKAPQEVRQRYEDALAQLTQLAKGLLALPPDENGTTLAPFAGEGYSNCRVFTECTLRDF